MNFFSEVLHEACLQLENLSASEINMAAIREPVWAYLRQHCNSFAAMSDHAVFSDIFTLNTVGVMTNHFFLSNRLTNRFVHRVTMRL